MINIPIFYYSKNNFEHTTLTWNFNLENKTSLTSNENIQAHIMIKIVIIYYNENRYT